MQTALAGKKYFYDERVDFEGKQIYLVYIDEYRGETVFVGGETLALDSEPIWGTVYFGFTKGSGAKDFLKKILLEKADTVRLDGEDHSFKNEEGFYTTKNTDPVKGSFDFFVTHELAQTKTGSVTTTIMGGFLK
jgi:hypothetical protein